MSRRRWRRRCRAKRSDGTPCRGWAISGGYVCTAHGGASPQARLAAEVRLVEDAMRRCLAAAVERLERERQAWWLARVRWAAGVLDVDPEEVAAELARPLGAVFLLVEADTEWPAGLRDEDAPQLRLDRRYGRRRRAREALADA